MPRLLLEIGCEELPASFCRWAEKQLAERWLPHLRAEGRVFVSHRRLAFVADNFSEDAGREEKRGPAESVAFDEEGRPSKAAKGFAASIGLPVEKLVRREGYVWGQAPGPPLRDRLRQIIGGLGAGKTMAWYTDAEEQLRFLRPIRWICAKLDDQTLDLGYRHVPSVGFTYGHRFTAGKIDVRHAEEYVEALRAGGVEPDTAERRRLIREGLDALGDWSDPAGVLEEVVYLVESPIVLPGVFHERFLELPPRVVETAMQSHQRYFPLGGNGFAFVANGGEPETVVRGNERVLEGRLDDAHFTFERDVARGIEALAAELGSITFVTGAGSFADKAARLVALVEALGGGEASREAARLAKADQAAELVREFPDLEGHIGAEYARLAGFPEAVCAAIDEQYLPDAADGPLPKTEAGRVLAAAEKIDNLTVAFALGERPTGSRDPYGLRRAAIGLCRLALEGGLELDLAPLVEKARDLLVQQGAELKEDPGELVAFVQERLEGLLEVPVEFVRAARAGSVSELGALARLAETLARQAQTQAFERAYVAYDRAARLAGKANGAAPALDPALAVDEAEIALIEALGTVSPKIEAAVQTRDFDGALEAAAELGPAVDRFFDEVLVMAEDSSIRANRLRLLLEVRDAVGALGDFSQIPR